MAGGRRVLVTGARGMLGTDVCAALAAAGDVALPTARSGDVTHLDCADFPAARRVLAELRPDAVIHCAAYTAVDAAESDPDGAYRGNALASWAVAAACAERDIPLCAVSTDFVYDGAKAEPYTEFDPVNPLGVYGASKLAGENSVREVWPKHWIVRTSWLYGLHGKCFPNTILNAAATRPELKVVADQRGTPTYTPDLAAALVRLLDNPLYGTYHVANSETATWHEFASEALSQAGLNTPVHPIRTEEWPVPARRPANSALRMYALELQGWAPLRPWREALAEYVRERRALAGA
jgi:dTDP-4-dehydrorhamnose reductase